MQPEIKCPYCGAFSLNEVEVKIVYVDGQGREYDILVSPTARKRYKFTCYRFSYMGTLHTWNVDESSPNRQVKEREQPLRQPLKGKISPMAYPASRRRPEQLLRHPLKGKIGVERAAVVRAIQKRECKQKFLFGFLFLLLGIAAGIALVYKLNTQPVLVAQNQGVGILGIDAVLFIVAGSTLIKVAWEEWSHFP